MSLSHRKIFFAAHPKGTYILASKISNISNYWGIFGQNGKFYVPDGCTSSENVLEITFELPGCLTEIETL